MSVKMKKKRIKIQTRVIFILFCISIFMSLLMNQTQAANETNNSNTSNTGVSQNTVTQSNTSNTANQTTTNEASNANLSNLGIRPHDFTGFRYGTTSYEVVVPEDTETVEVYATTQAQKAKVTGTGKKTLEKGENKVEVVVTAEDGTTKTYTINIIREMQQEHYEDTDEITNIEKGNGLASLKINDLKLSPEFKTNVYQYEVKYIGEDDRLEIEAQPTEDEYVIEVMGNENLQEGENFITILVSEEDGANVATYQITVNKTLIDEEAIAKETEKREKLQMAIIGGIAAVVVIAIIIFIVIRRRNSRLEEEYSGRISYDEEDDDYDEYEEEVPKAFRGKRFREEETEENPIINKGFEEDKEEEAEINQKEANRMNPLEDEEEDFEKMPKDELKEKFLNGYTSQIDMDFDFDDNRYQNNRKKGKHKGKRFK